MSNCTYKVKIKDIQNNYKVIMEDIQNKYKFKIFCTGNSYDDTEIREEIEALQDELDEAEEELEQYKTIYNALPKVTGEGSNIVLNNTANSLMKFKEYKGDTYQETTTGKNLLKPDIATTNTRGTTTTYNSETGYFTTTGTTTSAYPWLIDTNINISSGKTLTLSTNINYPTFARCYYTANDYEQLTPTQPTKTMEHNIIKIVILSNIASGVQVNETYYVQIEEGSSATTFEKFTYGASPNPDYPQNIEVVTGNNTIKIEGKNYAKSCNGIWFNGTAFKYYTQAQGYGFKAEIKPNTTYTISKKNASNRFSVIIGENDVVNNNSFSRILIQEQDTSRTTYTFTSQENEKYVFFGVYRGTNETEIASACENVQIEEGQTATTFEPYVSQTYPVNLGNIELCKISTYQDRIYQLNNKWYLEKQIGKVVLNGSETEWSLGGNYNNIYQFDYSNPSIKLLTQYSNVSLYSNYFGTTSTWGSSWEKNNIALHRVNFNRIRYQTSEYVTVEQFKTWLNTHNVTTYYLLETPTTTEITDTTLIGQLETISKQLAYKGQTNIIVSGNLPVIINAEALKDLSTEETTVASVTRLQSIRPTIIQPEINNIEEQPEEIEEEIPEQE